MEKKKVGKLEFKKYSIANMNDQDLSGVWGGTATTTVPCYELSIATIAYTVEKVSEAIYSMVGCYGDKKPFTENVSDVQVWFDGQPACQLRGVDIHGIKP